MKQLPIFVNLAGRKVIVVGDGEAAQAKRRLIERAGGTCVEPADCDARLAFVAVDDFEAIAGSLKARGLLVNVVDQPGHCDFTTPAVIDRDPVLLAIGTGGASAGLAKALRQRLELLLPQGLGALAGRLRDARRVLRQKWPDAAARRKAIDDALDEGGPLDPFADSDNAAFSHWLASDRAPATEGLHVLILRSADPDEMTLREARLLGKADHIWHDADMPMVLLNRARADAVRYQGAPPDSLPKGLALHVRLQSDAEVGTSGQ